MKKFPLLVLLLTFFISLSQAQAQTCSAVNRESCVYVSTLTGNRVYRFDAGTKTGVVIHDGSGRTVPELPAALVEGPDKLLYYADTSNCSDASAFVIRRFDPFARVGAKGLNSTLEGVLAGSICPTGLTFDVEGNLYANTQPFTDVYKIVKVQNDNTQTPVSKVSLGQLNGSATALAVLPVSSTNSSPGTGIIFSNSGDLFFIGPNPDQVLFKSGPPFSSAEPFITTGLSNPIGIAQDNLNNIFIANHQDRNILRCDSGGGNCSQFATFVDSAPVYLDTNSGGNLFVATEQIIGEVGANGKIWRLTAPEHSLGQQDALLCPGSPNCELVGSIPKVKGQIAGAYGIGLSATSAKLSLGISSGPFGPGPDGVFGTEDDIASRTFYFGTSLFILGYPSGAIMPHTVTVKAQEVFPGDLAFGSPATSCNSYHGKKGKCVVYELLGDPPVEGRDYNDEYSVYIRHSGQIPVQPAILHDSRSLAEILLPGPDFPDNLFTRFDRSPLEFDPGTGGKSTDNFTAYVSVDLGALGNDSTASYQTPIDATQVTEVKKGKILPVKISITDQFGNTVTNATVRLGVAQIVGNSIFPDEVRSNVNSENLFRVQSNVYLYSLITDDLALGLHVLTTVSDKNSPFKIPARTAVINVVP